MSKVIKKPTRTKKRKPLLIVSESASMALNSTLSTSRSPDPKRFEEVRSQATALGYDVIVLPPGVSAYVSVTA
jgi:hypothetical protein